MPLKVEFNHPDMPKGEEFDLCGIPVENGGSVELTDAQERGIAARFHRMPRERLEASPFAKVTGTAILSKKDLEDYFQAVVETPEVPEDGGGEG